MRKEPGRGGKPKSAAGVAGDLRHLKALLNWAHRQGMLSKKPMLDIPKVGESARGRPLTPEEFGKVLAARPASSEQNGGSSGRTRFAGRGDRG